MTPRPCAPTTPEFHAPDAPEMNFVFTVCDTTAAEERPLRPGQTITGHWGLPNPAFAFGRSYRSRVQRGIGDRQPALNLSRAQEPQPQRTNAHTNRTHDIRLL